jgi:hypothetical protein
MLASQTCDPLSTDTSAMTRLHHFLRQRQAACKPVEALETFEQELHALFVAAEREALSQELARFDVDVPVVEVEGQRYRRVLRCAQTYCSAAGPVRVERTLYRTGQGADRALCPLELRAGIIEGYWTPLAAKQATWVVVHLTPQEGEECLAMLGNMAPSKSSLDRLPKQLSTRWEQERRRFEAALRQPETVPEAAVTLAVSLDGVMVPMKDGGRRQKRAHTAARGHHQRGPAGHQEVGCATLSFYDKHGERLGTRRLARMPERHKRTLKASLTAEVFSALTERPDLRVVKLADGAPDNWSYLDETLPVGEAVVDFFHATEHLHGALGAAYGETSPACQAQFDKLRRLLRDDPKGVEKVIRALRYLRRCYPRRKTIRTALAYFRRHRHRMQYAQAQAQSLPIGSGVVEAACKTVVTQRMKRSGMRWRHDGGQAILTFRTLCQSERFDRAWALLAQTYQREVKLPQHVIALSDWR